MSPAPDAKTMTPLEWGMLVTLSALWGGSFLFNGIAVRELPTLTVVVSRVALAAIILHVVVSLSVRASARSIRHWRVFLVMGALNNAIPFSLIVWGQAHIASGLAAILNATTPLFTALFAHVLTKDERLTPGRIAGIVLGLLGVAVMTGSDVIRSLGVDVAAQIACLGAALSYALAGIYGRRFKAMGVSPLDAAAGQVTASALLLLPFACIVDRPWQLAVPGPATVAALVAVATLSTALGYILYFRILATAGATNLLLVTFLIPVSAVCLGVAILGETLLAKHLLGMGFIGAGLAAIDGRPWQFCVSRCRTAHVSAAGPAAGDARRR
jgi:drug/metabolite transporter (DMT)-like permease